MNHLRSCSVNTPIKLNQDTNFQWNKEDRISRDCNQDGIQWNDQEPCRILNYQLTGYDPSPHKTNHMLGSLVHYQRVGPTFNNIDTESDLVHSEPSNLREINQLFTRPCVGSYAGAGQPSSKHKDVETALFQGLLTNSRQKTCKPNQGRSPNRYQCLPEFGNPQRIQHIIPAPPELGGWIRGGDATRDFVRRVDYQKLGLHRVNRHHGNK